MEAEILIGLNDSASAILTLASAPVPAPNPALT